MSGQPFAFAGVAMVADLSGGLYLPDERTLVAADLHLEKGSAFASRGQLLPPYDTRATLHRLSDALARYRPARVVLLGDSFHDSGAGERLHPSDRARLGELAAGRDWLWIAGNHDPAPPAGMPGEMAAELRLGPLTLRHEAEEGASAGEVSGHYHPKARLSVRGRSVHGRCFVHDARRLVLPAFGAYAGGLDVLDPALRRLFGPGMNVLLLGRARVHGLALGGRRP